jgi:hypothetical protein
VSSPTTPTSTELLRGAFLLGLTCGSVLTALSGALGLYVGSCTLNTRPTTDVFAPAPPVVLQGTLPDHHHDEDSGP